MRYFSYHDHDPDVVRTFSEDEIRKQYYPVWYELICNKYEQAYVDENYSFEDCLDDWIIIMNAWKVEE